jgi:hypothetical protein
MRFWLVVHTQQHVVQAYRQYYGKIEDVHYACIKCKGKGCTKTYAQESSINNEG